MYCPSDLETPFQSDFDHFIDPALLALPAAPAGPDPPSSQPLSTTPERHGYGLAAEPCFPTNLRQDFDENPPINSTSHMNSTRRPKREFHRRKFSSALTGSQHHFPKH